MPTAVERLTKFLTRAFSLNVVEGAATQALFARLDTQIDAAVTALETAATPQAFNAAAHKYGHIFRTFGADGLNLDHVFVRIASVLGVVDDALAENSSAMIGPRGAFLALDHQLFTTGHDLGAFGVGMNHMGAMRSQAALPGVVASEVKATAALQTDFNSLSVETTALVADLTAPGASAALNRVAATLRPMEGEFAALATDFGNFNSLLGGDANASPAASTSGAASPLTFNGVFASLDADFVALDKSLHSLAGPVANILLHPAPPASG